MAMIALVTKEKTLAMIGMMFLQAMAMIALVTWDTSNDWNVVLTSYGHDWPSYLPETLAKIGMLFFLQVIAMIALVIYLRH